ncbi:MAG: HesA/MoeB/ThiF family protein [Methylocella sp.]
MIKLVFPKSELSDLARQFRAERLESFALILARPVQTSAKDWRLLVQSIHVPAPAEYEQRSEVSVRPSAAFRLALEKRASRAGLSLIYCHSHPLESGIPLFSRIDDETEMPLATYSRDRIGKMPHIALLVGAEGFRARELGCGGAVDLYEIGRRVILHFPANTTPLANEYDRQVQAFGEEGQRAIQALRVAIVGLGGTGSVVAQQLAYLGVRRFLLIDPQELEDTNLNRVVGAKSSDVGRPKVKIARRMIKQLVPDAQVTAKQGNVLDKAVGRLVTDVDFIFCCTDSHGSRYFVNQLVYQYLIPCIDMGVVINVQDRRVTHFGGRVQMLAPGIGCLACTDGILSPDEIRYDLSNEGQRGADPYFLGRVNIKQPSVISLNSSAASAAVTMFLAAVAGIPSNSRSQVLRGIPGIVRTLEDIPREGCVNCAAEFYYGKGTLYDLPVRVE